MQFLYDVSLCKIRYRNYIISLLRSNTYNNFSIKPTKFSFKCISRYSIFINLCFFSDFFIMFSLSLSLSLSLEFRVCWSSFSTMSKFRYVNLSFIYFFIFIYFLFIFILNIIKLRKILKIQIKYIINIIFKINYLKNGKLLY